MCSFLPHSVAISSARDTGLIASGGGGCDGRGQPRRRRRGRRPRRQRRRRRNITSGALSLSLGGGGGRRGQTNPTLTHTRNSGWGGERRGSREGKGGLLAWPRDGDRPTTVSLSFFLSVRTSQQQRRRRRQRVVVVCPLPSFLPLVSFLFWTVLCHPFSRSEAAVAHTTKGVSPRPLSRSLWRRRRRETKGAEGKILGALRKRRVFFRLR